MGIAGRNLTVIRAERYIEIEFWPYSRITFIFSWLKYEEILKTLESQVG